MKDYVEIGPVPADEPCQQVGTPDYDPTAAREECERFIEVIRESLGAEPTGARLAVKQFPHELGSYYQVVCYFVEEFPEAIDYAFKCKAEVPTRWPSETAEEVFA